MGDAGAAAPLLGLLGALDRSVAGARILRRRLRGRRRRRRPHPRARAAERADRARARRPPRAALLRGLPHRAAPDLLHGDRGDIDVSPVAYWRKRHAILGPSAAARCGACGTVQFPLTRTCIECAARDEQRPLRLADQGVLYTFTNDHLVAGRLPERPIPRCVVELDGGGRMFSKPPPPRGCGSELTRIPMLHVVGVDVGHRREHSAAAGSSSTTQRGIGRSR